MKFKYYALMHPNKFFTCVSKTRQGFEQKVTNTITRWKAMQPRECGFTAEDYFKENKVVKVFLTIEPMEE